MTKVYLAPVEIVIGDDGSPNRAPKYIYVASLDPRPGLNIGPYFMSDYGFVDAALIVAHNISQAGHDALVLNADVFAFPDDLDTKVTDPGIDQFFESLHIPTDWLTPATDYRELLRQTFGMFQFNQRYARMAATLPLATAQGALSYQTNPFALTDAGQDFSPWVTAVAPAEWRVEVFMINAKGKQKQAAAYLGGLNGTQTSILVYQDQALTVPGWFDYVDGQGVPFLVYTVGFKVVTGKPRSIFDDGRTLESRFNTLSFLEDLWFRAAANSLLSGAGDSISGNPKFRSLAKQAGSFWDGIPIPAGSIII